MGWSYREEPFPVSHTSALHAAAGLRWATKKSLLKEAVWTVQRGRGGVNEGKEVTYRGGTYRGFSVMDTLCPSRRLHHLLASAASPVEVSGSDLPWVFHLVGLSELLLGLSRRVTHGKRRACIRFVDRERHI